MDTQLAAPHPRDFALVLKALGEGVVVSDFETGAYVFANPKAARILGFQCPEQIVATPPRAVRERFEVFDEQGRAVPPEAIPFAAAAEGRVAPPLSVRCRILETGEERRGLLTSIPLYDAAGVVRQVLTVMRDVTEQWRSERAMRFLTTASALLADSLDYQRTLQAVAGLVVPELAEGCVAVVVEEDGSTLFASAHSESARAAQAEALWRRFPPGSFRNKGPVAEAILAGEPVILRDLSAAGHVFQCEEHQRGFEALGYRELMVVPLSARGRVLGSLTLMGTARVGHFSDADLALAVELAKRAALAVDNARLYHEAQVALRRKDEEARENARLVESLREMERKSREDGERLRLALEAGRMGHWEWDIRTNRSSLSPTMERMHGLEPGTLDGTLGSYRRLVHPEDLARFEAVLRGILDGSSPARDCLYRVRLPDGSVRWLESRGELLRDEDGRPLRMSGVCADVTERLESEEKSRRLASEYAARAEAEAARQRITNILDGIGDPLFALDGTGRFLFLNRKAEELCGQPRERVVGRDVREVFPAVGPMTIMERIQRGLDSAEVVELEERFSTGAWGELRASCFDQGVAISVRDITARKLAQDARERQTRYEALRADVGAALAGQGELGAALERCAGALARHLDAALVRIWRVDPEENALELQAEAGACAGSPRPLRVSMEHPDLRLFARERREFITNALAERPPSTDPVLVPPAGFTAFAGYPLVLGEQLMGTITLFSFEPLPEDLHPTLRAIADIVSQGLERRRAEQSLAVQAEALARQAEELARSNHELEQFAHVTSHDLQEPLRMVASYTQLLARRYRGQLDADAEDFIRFAVDGVVRMQRVISDLLAYSRVGAGSRELVPTSCQAMVERALVNLRAAIEESEAEVVMEELPDVLGDELQLEQLFQNLIGNAVKFRGPERPRVRLSAERHGDEWELAVSDNGIGIAPEFHERIFVIFQRLHGREEYPGTGIGLALCKKIVERHGGRIGVRSRPGEGATFYVRLRAVPGAPEAVAESA